MSCLLVKNLAQLLVGGHFFKVDESGQPEVNAQFLESPHGECSVATAAQVYGVQGVTLQSPLCG